MVYNPLDLCFFSINLFQRSSKSWIKCILMRSCLRQFSSGEFEIVNSLQSSAWMSLISMALTLNQSLLICTSVSSVTSAEVTLATEESTMYHRERNTKRVCTFSLATDSTGEPKQNAGQDNIGISWPSCKCANGFSWAMVRRLEWYWVSAPW